MFRKECELTIFSDPDFFAAFPAVANLGGGRLIAVFRLAPSYRQVPGMSPDWYCHLDCNSRIVHCFSEDNGMTWSAPRQFPGLPLGVAQDGGVFYDGNTLLVNSFRWCFLPDNVYSALRERGLDEYFHTLGSSSAFPLGSFIFRSTDRGESWTGPHLPDPLPDGSTVIPGIPRRPHNRTNIVKLPDGRLLLAGQMFGYRPDHHSSVVLYQSTDGGFSWHYRSTPADDRGVALFEEPTLMRGPDGRLVMLLRTHRDREGNDFKRARLFRIESSDEGLTWSDPVNTGIHGEPGSLLPMSNGKVLLLCGHREMPCGVRARICNADVSDASEAEEIVIRDDGGRPNTGYPWATCLGGDRYLIAYYLDPPVGESGSPEAVAGKRGIFATIAEIR